MMLILIIGMAMVAVLLELIYRAPDWDWYEGHD